QLDVDGCLVCLRSGGANRAPLWACGALVGNDIHLFDPCLGLPLPGASPGQVATLAQVQAKPDVLKPLIDANDHPYDVTAEAVQQGEIYLAYPLSALAPRMRGLERMMQDPEGRGPIIKGNLALDPAALPTRFAAAAQKGASKDRPAVRVWPSGM